MIEMSVIIITPDSYETIRRLMRCLAEQTVRDKLEIVIVVLSRIPIQADNDVLKLFARVLVVQEEGIHTFSGAQAIGVREASGAIVAFTEDHCFPQRDWAKSLIQAHGNMCACVGPAIINGNPRTFLSRANLSIEYGPWLEPAPAGMVDHLPGHNSSYRRDVLLTYGNDLGVWLQSESLLHWDLITKGYKLLLEPRAKAAHYNFSDFFSTIRLRFFCGRIFAGSRSRKWSFSKRFLYFAGSPMIPVVRLYRVIRELRRPGRPNNLSQVLLQLLLLLLIIDGIGEMVGYACGSGNAMEMMTDMEFHRERFMDDIDRRTFSRSKAA